MVWAVTHFHYYLYRNKRGACTRGHHATTKHQQGFFGPTKETTTPLCFKNFHQVASCLSSSRPEESEDCAAACKGICPYVPCPRSFALDRGANLLSHLMTDLYTMLEIHKLNTISYHPKSNGMVERINQNLIWMLQSHATKYGVQWGRYLCAGTGFVGISKYPPPPMRTPKRSHHTTEC